MPSGEATFGVTASALVFLLAMVVTLLLAPRRIAILPLLCTTVMITMAQGVLIAGCHFTFIRILISVGFARVLLRRELLDFAPSSLDKVFAWWVGLSYLFGLALEPSYEQFINRSGFAYDSIGVYFLVRCFVRRLEDLSFAIGVLVGLCVVVASFMTIEYVTRINYFSFLGGVSQTPWERGDRFRCSGPFSHPIHAGTFGATLVPLGVGLWVYGKRRTAILGMIAGTVVTLTSSSSGPLMSWVYGIIGLCFWPVRGHMRSVRRGLLLGAVALHLIMKAPVWFLIGRVANVTGGDGWHRASIIDAFVRHFGEWWLIGTTYTAHWTPDVAVLAANPDMADMTNQFVYEGVSGGLLKLGLFIAIIVVCYKRVGRITNVSDDFEFQERFMYWALGSVLLAHIAAFMSVAYPQQMFVMYYCLLAFFGCEPQLAGNSAEDIADGEVARA